MCRGEKAKKIESKRQIHIEPKERPQVLSLRRRSEHGLCRVRTNDVPLTKRVLYH